MRVFSLVDSLTKRRFSLSRLCRRRTHDKSMLMNRRTEGIKLAMFFFN